MNQSNLFLNSQECEAVRISLASPQKIIDWSHGEVKSSETINYRTFKPERDGLFCGKIFGPIVDYECICGKYKRMKHRGITCEKCGVEVIESKVRRERSGHIKLSCPVSHVWYLKGLPSRLANILDMTLRDVEKVLYFDAYVVMNAATVDVKPNELIDETSYQTFKAQDEDFNAMMGAEAIKELIQRIDITSESERLRGELQEVNSETRRKKIIKRLKVLEAFKDSNIDPSFMILEVVPVISPDLRPLVPLEGGRFATSDLNDLYRRVIHRNNRLKRLIELNAPEIIVKNEKRMLQEAVDALFDNGRRGKPILGTNKRPLKSLSDSLKGKYGRFRQNLLGKRVDYSARTVIVVGPNLKLNQCGLPKLIALELFKPFVYKELIRTELAVTIKVAKKMVDNKEPEIWAALNTVVEEHPILLNRAPTLHRLGIMAFEPTLIEGKAVQLHPLVCSAYNADFDGDQMAIHVPLSIEAQVEAKMLMLATNNILSPATGKPVMLPTQDLVLGLYWLTNSLDGGKGEGLLFGNMDDLLAAYEYKSVGLNTKVRLQLDGKIYDTTPGRAILYSVLPKEIPFTDVNKLLKKASIENLVDKVYRLAGNVSCVDVLDQLKNLGFKVATETGFSISMAHMTIPDEKKTLIKKAQDEVNFISEQHMEGIITDGERYNKVIDIWSRVTEEIAHKMIDVLGIQTRDKEGKPVVNSIFVMADSGARGSINQSRQLGGMRGLMAKPTGEIIETPITANFREGLSSHQYFISTHGARKGLADTALKTARSGYLTRRLVDVAQDSVITIQDCGSTDGIIIKQLLENGEIIQKLSERILGRVAAEHIRDPFNQEVICEAGTLIDEDMTDVIGNAGIESIMIRSVLTCIAPTGVCAKCYGRDLARGYMISVGEAVGVIAAQSIGEPGTQLTMRTFHIGGTANRRVEATSWEAQRSGSLSFVDIKTVTNSDKVEIIMSRRTEALIHDHEGREVERYMLPYGSKLMAKEGDEVTTGQRIAEWDPFSTPIISDVDGMIKYVDIINGQSMRSQMDENTGLTREVIIDSSEYDLKPRITLRGVDSKKTVKRADGKTHPGFYLPVKSELVIREGNIVTAGEILAKIPRETAKNKDITGGLPRVVELFEARKPKDPCVISDIDGRVEFGEDLKRKHRLRIVPEVGEPKEYLIPQGKHILVFEDEYVKSGDPLTDGAANPHDILRVKGVKELQKFLVDEVQEVYRLQGVKINDKHIEVIIRQMLNKVQVSSPGESTFVLDEIVSKPTLAKVNRQLEKDGLAKVEWKPVLLGITKSALETDSFISAASFQETTKVLTEASIKGKIDTFQGLKENVILGRLVPAGTGFNYKKVYDFEVVQQDQSEETVNEEA